MGSEQRKTRCNGAQRLQGLYAREHSYILPRGIPPRCGRAQMGLGSVVPVQEALDIDLVANLQSLDSLVNIGVSAGADHVDVDSEGVGVGAVGDVEVQVAIASFAGAVVAVQEGSFLALSVLGGSHSQTLDGNQIVHAVSQLIGAQLGSDIGSGSSVGQNGKQVCVIDVPRDLVVKSGRVDKDTNELVLVLVNDEEIRVDVSHLIEYVTGGTAADGIITVTVSDDFVTTATINDGTITETKLHADVTAKLNKVWDAEGAAATAKEEAIAAAAKDAGDKAAVVLGEAQKYADEKVAALAGEGNTTTVKAVADRVTTLEGAGYLTEVEADTGLKVVAGTKGANNKVAIDETVVFVLDCNW